MRCRLALPAALMLLALPLGTGCRLGGSSSMTSWLPGQGSAADDGEELASAPPFEGAIVKPSSKATPYPTTSTPQGYVMGEAGEQPATAQIAAADAPAAAATPTAPVTYGMKPAEVAALTGTAAAATPPQPQPAQESVAAQEGLYAPLTQTTPAAGSATPPADTVASGFSAAGGTSAGAYPPEETVGLAPAASATAGSPAPQDAMSQPSAGFAPSAEAMPQSSAFAATPAAGGSAFSTQPEPVPAAGGQVGGAAAPSETGSAFGQSSYAAAPTASAFAQQPAASSAEVPADVPSGSSAASPVADQRYASTGSRFGGGGFTEPAAVTASTPAEDPLLAPPQQTAQAAPWQQGASSSAAEQTTPASAWPASSPAENVAAASATESAAGQSFGTAGAAEFSEPSFGSQASQPTADEGSRPPRRPDPMYRPAGTSSYRPAEPIFPNEPASRSPVQMATFEETIPLPPQQ